MVNCIPTIRLLIPIKHWEVYNPERFPLIRHKTTILTYLNSQGTQSLINHLGLICAKEYEITAVGTCTLQNPSNSIVREEFHDWGLQSITSTINIIYLDIGKTTGTIDTDKFGVTINILTTQTIAIRNTKRCHPSIWIIGWTREDLEVHLTHQVSDINQLQLNSQIRAIRAVTTHRLVITHLWEWLWKFCSQNLLEETSDHILHQPHNLLLIEECSLYIELGKFRLTVSTQILVTETAHHLIVTIHSRDHQQLLE